MCFSATASFAASGGLLIIGGASLKVATKKQKMIALIPLLFGIQQAFEGWQWLYLNQGQTCAAAGYGFLFFAFLLWPVYIPLTVYLLDKKSRSVLKWFIALGGLTALLYLSGLVTSPLVIAAVRQKISYKFTVPFPDATAILYLLVVFGALIASSLKFFRWLGIIILMLAAITELFYYLTFASVWCFFAAITSALIYFYLKKFSTV